MTSSNVNENIGNGVNGIHNSRIIEDVSGMAGFNDTSFWSYPDLFSSRYNMFTEMHDTTRIWKNPDAATFRVSREAIIMDNAIVTSRSRLASGEGDYAREDWLEVNRC